MSNGYAQAFDELIMPRIEATPRDAASKLVLEGLRHGIPLGTAVVDVIEQLPAKATRRLRAWTSLLDGYHEWQGYEKDGWSIERGTTGRFAKRGERLTVYAPSPEKLRDRPSDEAVAAAAGAGEVSLVGKRETDMLVYVVTQGALE